MQAFCRRNPTGKDQLFPHEMEEIARRHFKEAAKGPARNHLGFRDGNRYDELIAGWTQYWNEIFKAIEPLSPNHVKALFATESGFTLKPKPQRVSKDNFARGPLQITDDTRKILADERGEIRDHSITVTASDVLNPNIALSVAVRWLFHKKDLASDWLARPASWDESVGHYKGYLRKRKDYRSGKGMKDFHEYLPKLN